ncbi:beta strand repeat-containing protein, partial [Kiloniella antarctica]
GDSDTASADIDLGGNLTFKDDGPSAVDDTDCVQVVVGGLPPQNIAFVVDESGSVGRTNYETQIDGVRTFMNSLVTQGDPSELALSLVTFGSDAEDYGTFVYKDDGNGVLDLDDFVRVNNDGTLSSDTLDDTLIVVRADYDNGGSTNYDAGMQSLFGTDSEYMDNPVSGLSGAENRLYFISDGGPNASNTSNSSEIDTDIATAITTNNIQVTGIGVGTSSSVEGGLEDYFLNEGGTDASNPSIPASQYSFVSVPNFADLADVLDGTAGSAPVATGNVVTGTDVAGGDTNVTDGNADTMGADGFGSISWFGATGTTVVGDYGTLTVDADGNYSYALDYTNPAVTGLPLGQTLPETFDYTVTDGDGDTDTATLTLAIKGADHDVTITDLTPQISGGDVVVDEDDLADGSDDTPEPTTVIGDFTISAVDGLGCIIIKGQPAAPYEFTEAELLNSGTINLEVITELGNTLTITGYNPTTGVVSYSYELGDNEAHAPGADALFDNIALTLKDTDGDSVDATLSVQIVDDAPTAVDDGTFAVAEDGSVNINVLVNDTAGADGVDPDTGVSLTTGATKGTVTENADGTFTYLANAGAVGSDSFTYTITDSDGDTSTATVTLEIAADSTPVVTSTSGTVEEAALSDGSNPSSDAESTTGSLTITTGGDALQTVEVQDDSGNWVDVTGGGTVTGEHGDLVVSEDAGSYTWTYTLSDNTLDHSDTSTTDGDSDRGAADTVPDNFGVRVTDNDGDVSSTGTIAINIEDDGPTAVADSVAVDEGSVTLQPQNIGVVMDFSGSVNGTERAAEVDSVKAFAQTLFNGNPNVTISIVAFDDNAGTVGVFTDLASLNAAMDAAKDGTFTDPKDGSYSGGSVTDFEAGIEELFSNSNGAGYSEQPGANNQIFFLSDGNRNDGASTLSSSNVVLDNNGKALLASGAIELTAVAIGSGINTQTFEDFFGTAIVDAPTEVVTSGFAGLADALNGSVNNGGSATGNLLTNDTAGADGFAAVAITQVVHNSVTYEDTDNDGVITIATTKEGGTLEINTATGEYSYTAPSSVDQTEVENFTYTVVDGDGDQSTANLEVTINDLPDPLSAVDDQVITNITSGDIDIPDWVLTQNDGGSSARDISGVSNATGGTTSHDGASDVTTFTLPDIGFGLEYTTVTEAANDAYNNPLNDTRGTAVNLTDRSQWGPVTDGNAVNVKNAALPSILFKGDIDNKDSGNNRDYDYVAVSLLAGEKLILDIDNGRGGNQNVDTWLRLYDASGNELAENDDSAITNGGAGSTDGRDSYLEYTASSDGTYYVRVESYDRNDDGDYDLWLSVDNSGVSTPATGFDYTVADGADSDDASVVISTVDSLTLTGTDDGEILIGGSLADIINAGGGDDILIGGAGANVLTGGTGADTFVLSDTSGVDVVTDFNGSGDDGTGDVLNLHDLLVEVGLDQAAIDGLNDGNINDYVHLDSTAGVTTVSVSSDGNSFTTVATLSGVGDSEIVKVQVDEDHILNMTTF